MKRISLICLALAMPLAVMAQTTVFSDNFKTDVSDPSASYLQGLNGVTMSWANGTGMSLIATATGKNSELIGAFSSTTLTSPGQTISFIVNFNAPNFFYGTASSAGNITFGLANSLGTGILSLGATEAVNKTSTGGATAGDLGFYGNIPFETTGKVSEKLFAKITGATRYNSISFYTAVSPASPQFNRVPQIGTGSSGLISNLANNDEVTLTFKLTYLAAGQMQVQDTLYDITQGLTLFNLDTGATNNASATTWYVPTTTFDTFAIGLYSGNDTAYNLNIESVQVLANVPEPSAVALFLLGGFGALGFVRRFRR
jgi:PEP-CTERM motif